MGCTTLANPTTLESNKSHPGMRMAASEQADFIKNHLGPVLANAGLETQIFIYDHNWDRPEYAIESLGDPAARQYVSGTAFHCYAGNVNAQSAVHDASPDKSVMISECTGLVKSMEMLGRRGFGILIRYPL